MSCQSTDNNMISSLRQDYMVARQNVSTAGGDGIAIALKLPTAIQPIITGRRTSEDAHPNQQPLHPRRRALLRHLSAPEISVQLNNIIKIASSSSEDAVEVASRLWT